MFAIVVAACLSIPATDISPKYEKCSLVFSKQLYDNEKLCEADYTNNLQKQLTKVGVHVTNHKCIDIELLKKKMEEDKNKPNAEGNSVDPKLKPLTPQQKKDGFESL